MSLIREKNDDDDKNFIKDQCDAIHDIVWPDNVDLFESDSRQSYFIEGDELDKYCFNDIRDYDIKDIISLRYELESLWSSRGTLYMKELCNTCIVAAMKGRTDNAKTSSCVVSEFIYEF